MKQALIVLLAVTALTAAMVPRQRREADVGQSRTICAEQTPCAWVIYNPKGKRFDETIENTYCICGEGAACQMSVDDPSANALVYRCRPQVKADS